MLFARSLVVRAVSAATGTTMFLSAGAEEKKTTSWPELAQSSSAAVRRTEDGSISSVTTGMNYLAKDVDKVWTNRDASGSDDSIYGAKWSPRDVEIRNGRLEGKKTLERNGFQLFRSPAAPLVDYYDKDQVVATYYSQCEALVKEATGAKRVVAFDHNLRSAPSAGRTTKGGTTVQGPATMVHADYTAASAPRRVAQLGEAPKINDVVVVSKKENKEPILSPPADAASGTTFQLVNVWRPLKAVEERPLAFCDAATVDEADLVTFEIRYPDRTGENWFAKFATKHAWYYFPNMAPEEAVLLKTWDSAVSFDDQRHHKGAQFVLHSAFHDPSSPKDATPRESIEVRTVAIF